MTTNASRNSGSHRKSGGRRDGAAAVEFAMVAPVAFVLIFGFVEFGRGMFALSAMEEASRAGCRAAILKDATSNDIQTAVASVLTPANVKGYLITTTPALPATVEQWDPVTVAVSVSYRNISWLPTPRFLSKAQLSASCTLPKEGEL